MAPLNSNKWLEHTNILLNNYLITPKIVKFGNRRFFYAKLELTILLCIVFNTLSRAVQAIGNENKHKSFSINNNHAFL